jgi:gliding motility-associated-like protein
MLKRFIPFSFLMLFSLCLMAQRPIFIEVDRTITPDVSRVACDNKAGTSTQTLHPLAQSNDKRFLCYKDKLVIKHNKDQVLSSDPIASTPPGVAYLYLTCNPTKTGLTIQDIAADPCILKTPSGGTPPGFGFYVESGGNLKGDNEFENDGYWQNIYGSGKPFKLVFAPITFDAFDYTVSPPRPKYEGIPSGQCVNVNTTAAFDVIYLNEIKTTNRTQGDKQGSFKVIGGLSEYDNTTNYTVSISLKSNNAIKGTITSGAAKHDGTVAFTAPQNGTYIINIEDGKSCGTTFEMVLSSAIDVLITNDTICNTANATGRLLILPSGGTGSYTYTYQKTGGGTVSASVSLPSTGTTINDLAAGEYIITVTDGSGATVVKNGLIVQASQVLSVNISKTDPSCPEILNGNATANVVGGFPPYYYEWSNGEKGSNKQNITGIGVINGNVKYTVTVTDRFGCTNDASANLTINKMTITNVNSNDATCYGAKNGQINFDVTGGNAASGNYNFRWKSKDDPTFLLEYVAVGANFWAQNPGRYTVTITDDVGCSIVDTTLEIKATRRLVITKNISNAKCFNEANGAVAIQVTEQGPITTASVNFAWNPIPGTFPNTLPFSQTYSNVRAGKYFLSVTDAQSCIAIDSVAVAQPAAALNLSVKTQKSPTCIGKGTDGEIEITASGGTPSYSYVWARGGILLPNITNRITNQIAGKYAVTVSDANGCSQIQEVELVDPPGPTVSAIEIKNVNCSVDNNGSIKVTAQGANPADVLTYKWSNGASTNEIFNLTPGKYTVSISDSKGCLIIRDTVVKSPAPLTLVGQPAVTKPKCPATADGSIEIEIAGGTPEYTCSWESASINGSFKTPAKVIKIDNLPVGVYNITVTDQNNCPSLVIPLVNIAVPDILTLTKAVNKIISCANSKVADGEAIYTVIAGNSPSNQYFFSWAGEPNGISTSLNQPITIDKLSAGWNTITVSDGNCTQIDSIFIGTPPAVAYDSTTLQINPATCFGDANGSIVINGRGGEGPYRYSWVPTGLGSNPVVNNLPAGDYIAIITDSKNCEFRTTLTVPEPPAIVITLDTVNTDSIRCHGGNTGKITLNVTGGNDAIAGSPKYAFAWSPNVSNSNIALNLIARIYEVTVIDSKGCDAKISQALNQPQFPISFVIDTITPPLCNGYLTNISILSASGGNGSQLKNYRFSVDDGAPINADGGEIPVSAGKHTIRVFDPEGCPSTEQTVDISEPPAIRVYLGQDIELELGDSRELGAIIEPTGIPIVKYNWSWSPNATPLTFSDSCKNTCAQIIKPLVDGYYILQVESIDGCLGLDTINLTIDRNRNVFIPNVFSPNVDGTNDFFEIFADDQSVESILDFRVYDRWGTLVFQNPAPFKPSDSRVVGNRWNGYYKENPANLGVYVYLCQVKFVDGVEITFRGDVTLTR